MGIWTLAVFSLGIVATLTGQWALRNFAIDLGQPEHPQRRSMADIMQPLVEKNHVGVLIVGAGHAGLAMAARLDREKVSFMVVEKDEPGDSWARRYERLHLHTIKSISHLPYWPYPADFPTFISKDNVARYLKAYSQFLNVKSHTKVVEAKFNSVHRLWRVVLEHADGSQAVWTCKVLVAATGQEAAPLRPSWPTMAQYTGRMLHAAEYTSGREFVNQSVLVVGFGNSGSEMALDLWEYHARPSVLVRSPIHMMPRWVTRISGHLYPLMRRISPADHKGSQPLLYSLLWPEIEQYNISLKTSGIVEDIVRFHRAPVQDLGTMQLIHDGEIDVIKSEVASFPGGKQVKFASGDVRTYDAVLLATGYQHSQSPFAQFLDPELARGMVNEDGVVPSGFESPTQPQLYLLGFEDFGGRLAEINTETMTVLEDMKEKKYV